jgi:PAS domain-containing protein
MDKNQTGKVSLLESIKDLTEIFQQFPYPIYYLDNSNIILFSNPASSEIIPSSSVGKPLSSKYTSSHTVEIEGEVWNSFFENGFLFLIPNFDTKKIILTQQIKDKETRVKTQKTILV